MPLGSDRTSINPFVKEAMRIRTRAAVHWSNVNLNLRFTIIKLMAYRWDSFVTPSHVTLDAFLPQSCEGRRGRRGACRSLFALLIYSEVVFVLSIIDIVVVLPRCLGSIKQPSTSTEWTRT